MPWPFPWALYLWDHGKSDVCIVDMRIVDGDGASDRKCELVSR